MNMQKKQGFKLSLVLSTVLASGVLASSISYAKGREDHKLPSIEINFGALEQLRQQGVSLSKTKKEESPLQESTAKAVIIREPVQQKAIAILKTQPVKKPKVKEMATQSDENALPPRRLPEENIQKTSKILPIDIENNKNHLPNKNMPSVYIELPKESIEVLPIIVSKEDAQEAPSKSEVSAPQETEGYKGKVLSFFDKMPSVKKLFENNSTKQDADEIAENNELPVVNINDLEDIAEVNSENNPVPKEVVKLENIIDDTEEVDSLPDYISSMHGNIQIILPNKVQGDEVTITSVPTPQFRPVTKEMANIDIIVNTPTPVDVVDQNIELENPIVIEAQDNKEDKVLLAQNLTATEKEPAPTKIVEPKIPDPIAPQLADVINLIKPSIESIDEEKWLKTLEEVRQRSVSQSEESYTPPVSVTIQAEQSEKTEISLDELDELDEEDAKSEKSFLSSLKDWMPSFAESKEKKAKQIEIADITMEYDASKRKNEAAYVSDITKNIKAEAPEIKVRNTIVIKAPKPEMAVSEVANINSEDVADKESTGLEKPVDTKELAEFELTSLPQVEEIVPEEVTLNAKQVKKPSALLSISFDSEEIMLKEFDKDRLSELVQQILPSDNKVKIVSYAPDDVSEANSSRRISLKRAIAIRAAMMESGLDSARINVQAVGNVDNKDNSNSVNIFVLN